VSGGSRSELYVYYRVAHANAQTALQTVRAFQQCLRGQHPGLAARVLQRSNVRGGDVTLMEIYALHDGSGKGIESNLRLRIEDAAAALTPMLSSPRQVEVFDALD